MTMVTTTCACLGPQNGEPLCPCQMQAARQHLGGAAPPQIGSPARGCICPPGSEATCQGIGCPRRAFSWPLGGS